MCADENVLFWNVESKVATNTVSVAKSSVDVESPILTHIACFTTCKQSCEYDTHLIFFFFFFFCCKSV
jgi:hypothetical protein